MLKKFAFLSSGCMAAAALALSAAGASAAPVTLQCGDVVTHSVKLAADVVCQDDSSPGLVVGENGITIDLNGHTVRTVVSHSSQIGIDNSAGHDGVTIRNGTVMTFDTTILLDGASRNQIRNVNALAFGTGISVTGGGRNRITGSDADSRGNGIEVSGSPGTEVVHNQLNSAFGTPLIVNSNRVLVARNTSGNIAINSGFGNVVERNSLVGAGAAVDGLLVSGAASNTAVLRNTATGWGNDGIHVESSSTLIVGNVANDNGNYGIEAVPGVISAHNHASGNGNPAQCLNVSC
jgi:parallel beta-helix repeat protein